MTAKTTDRAEINRRNAQKSTGPKTPEGKSRSRFNAVKHGMAAKTLVLPGEDPEVLRERIEAWTADLQPENDLEQYLVERAAAVSWQLDRADRADTARLAGIIRTAPAEEAHRQEGEAPLAGPTPLLGPSRADGPLPAFPASHSAPGRPQAPHVLLRTRRRPRRSRPAGPPAGIHRRRLPVAARPLVRTPCHTCWTRTWSGSRPTSSRRSACWASQPMDAAGDADVAAIMSLGVRRSGPSGQEESRRWTWPEVDPGEDDPSLGWRTADDEGIVSPTRQKKRRRGTSSGPSWGGPRAAGGAGRGASRAGRGRRGRAGGPAVVRR